jgi:Cu(I)/Ag(I) efflux system membrane fusion protein
MTSGRIAGISWGVLTLVLVALSAGAGYWWANRSSPQRPTAAMDDSAGNRAARQPASGERRILYWLDPMNPNVKFDKPGKSPFMDMELVPVYADEAGSEGSVHVNPSVVQNLGIRFARAEKAILPVRLRAVGNVAFDQSLLELVQARVEGFVTRLHVNAPQQLVRKGQPLATILAPQWLEAEQEYLALLDSRAPSAQQIREAARQRLKVLGVPEATIRAVETGRQADASTTIVAPIDGVIAELGVREGATFMPGATLFRINGLATVWVNAQIPEARISSITPGSTVEVQAIAWPGVAFEGAVIALLPEVDPVARTLTVRVAIKNAERRLSPGMYVSLDFSGPSGEPRILVPTEAVIATGERSVVILAREGGGFDAVDVTVGEEQGGRSAILSGLTEGQSVVVSGQFLIDSEASLKSTINRLESQGGDPAPRPEPRP